MESIKKINIKHPTYYLFNDIIIIKNFDSNLLKIDKNLYRKLIFITLDISQHKILVIMKVFIV